jgi:hypothetical protein
MHDSTSEQKHQEKLKTHSKSFQAITRTIRMLHEKDNVEDQMNRMFE